MFTLLKTDQLIIEESYGKPWVTLRRTSAPWGTMANIPHIFGLVLATLQKLDRVKTAMLMDMRSSPMNSNPVFERVVKEQLQQLPRFRKVAILTRTTVGRAQIDRMIRDVGAGPSEFFEDEEEASAYLATP